MAASFIFFFFQNVFGLTILYFHFPGLDALFLYSVPELFPDCLFPVFRIIVLKLPCDLVSSLTWMSITVCSCCLQS